MPPDFSFECSNIKPFEPSRVWNARKQRAAGFGAHLHPHQIFSSETQPRYARHFTNDDLKPRSRRA